MKNMNSQSKIELLAPAGNWSSLLTAIENGADSVYFGVKGMNMRANAGNFEISELGKIMISVHDAGKKGYLALNTIVQNHQLDMVRKILEAAKDASVDAVIMWDWGAIEIARELGVPFHVSTQASVSNTAALRFFASLGARRVVLARECTLPQIQHIVQEARDLKTGCDIEVFGHGAMCVSVSGRCFMSLDAFGRSANQGDCLQPCRREYKISDVDREGEFILGKDYVMSPKDLWTMPFLDQVIETGAATLKIEGRMRPAEYVAVVIQTYRQAIDAYYEGRLTQEFKQERMRELQTVYNRGFSNGFYFGEKTHPVSRNLEHTHRKQYIGEVRKFYPRLQVADVRIVQGELRQGAQILCQGKKTPARVAVVDQMQVNHKVVDVATRGQSVGIRLPFAVHPADKVFLWEEKKTVKIVNSE